MKEYSMLSTTSFSDMRTFIATNCKNGYRVHTFIYIPESEYGSGGYEVLMELEVPS